MVDFFDSDANKISHSINRAGVGTHNVSSQKNSATLEGQTYENEM